MTDSEGPLKTFGGTAQGLAKNPLGIIALFIVLVYGFAALVTAFGASLTPAERTPLIWFMVGFPVLVLGAFSWLVSRHSSKLYSPRDFQNEENWMRTQMEVAVSLTAASMNPRASDDTKIASSVPDVNEIVSAAQSVAAGPQSISLENWRSHILWVDDRPDNNAYERRAFEATGLRFTLARSTDEALEKLRHQRFAAVISDMVRDEGKQEGYMLLERIRSGGNRTPFFLYTSSAGPDDVEETLKLGGQGRTNNAQDLFRMVTRAAVQRGW